MIRRPEKVVLKPLLSVTWKRSRFKTWLCPGISCPQQPFLQFLSQIDIREVIALCNNGFIAWILAGLRQQKFWDLCVWTLLIPQQPDLIGSTCKFEVRGERQGLLSKGRGKGQLLSEVPSCAAKKQSSSHMLSPHNFPIDWWSHKTSKHRPLSWENYRNSTKTTHSLRNTLQWVSFNERKNVSQIPLCDNVGWHLVSHGTWENMG